MGQGTNCWCDLHTHTTGSDGALSPADLVEYAREKRLRAVAICDHDTVSGARSLYRAPDASEGPEVLTPLLVKEVEVVPGVEINCYLEGREVHILGYYVPFGKGPFQALLEKMQESREDRVFQTVRLLRDLGLPVEASRVMELSTGDSVGRPHVAQAMVEKGYAASVKDAFERYLGLGRPAYVERARLCPEEAVRAISSAGGVAVWAHPGTSDCLHLISDLVKEGLQGIEAFHPDHDRCMSEKCQDLASRYGLVVTGGSDFHGIGAGEGGDLGGTVVGYDVVEALRRLALAKR
ncbi:MAG: PHP domain-containing protein [Bacillota bacterium]